MPKRGAVALIVVLLAAAVAAAISRSSHRPAEAQSNNRAASRKAVTVTPGRGSSNTVFRARAKLVAPHPDKDPEGDNYHFIFSGAGGRRCRGKLNYALGQVPKDGARFVSARFLPGVGGSGERSDSLRWCKGNYRGRVEFRDFRPPKPEDTTEGVFKPVGRFSFSVR